MKRKEKNSLLNELRFDLKAVFSLKKDENGVRSKGIFFILLPFAVSIIAEALFVALAPQIYIGTGKIVAGKVWDIILAQLSVNFIAITVLSIFSDSDEVIYWEDVVKKRLIEPYDTSFRAFFIYTVILQAVSAVFCVAKLYLAFIVVFTTNVIYLFSLTYIMISCYYNSEKKAKAILEEGMKTVKSDNDEEIADLFNQLRYYTDIAFNNGNYIKVNKNLNAYYELFSLWKGTKKKERLLYNMTRDWFNERTALSIFKIIFFFFIELDKSKAVIDIPSLKKDEYKDFREKMKLLFEGKVSAEDLKNDKDYYEQQKELTDILDRDNDFKNDMESNAELLRDITSAENAPLIWRLVKARLSEMDSAGLLSDLWDYMVLVCKLKSFMEVAKNSICYDKKNEIYVPFLPSKEKAEEVEQKIKDLLKEFEDELKYDEYDIINNLKSIIHDILVLLDFNRFDKFFAEDKRPSLEVVKNIGRISGAYYKLFKTSILLEAFYWARELSFDSDAINNVVPCEMAYIQTKEYAIHYSLEFKRYCMRELEADEKKHKELMAESEKMYAEFNKAIANEESDETKDELYRKYKKAKEKASDSGYRRKLFDFYVSGVEKLLGDVVKSLDKDPTMSRYSSKQKENAKKCIDSYRKYLCIETEKDTVINKDNSWLVQYAHTLY